MTRDPHKIKFLKQCRVTQGIASDWISSPADGMNGCFIIPFDIGKGRHRLGCIASDGGGWEHVSVTDQTAKRSHLSCPSWEMMCRIKRAVWDNEECVLQDHVPVRELINEHP